ncbi:hypothetical protein [Marinobacter sp. JSM 1782161]|uniref:hypothetical protein n=1 Tax=Marinobacter sp. JSM 1782161 TaxID=2685906 RepID=UPI001401ED21|nr:hypothetical protein [Marinobacter sp. JSM 1782161]
MQTIASSKRETVFIPPFEAVAERSSPVRRRTRRARAGAILREWLRRYRARARLRRQLREMDAGLAEKDVGLPIGTLVEEARRPFWKA